MKVSSTLTISVHKYYIGPVGQFGVRVIIDVNDLVLACWVFVDVGRRRGQY